MQEFLFKTQLAHYFDAALSIDWPWSRYLIAVVVIAVIVYLLGEFLSGTRIGNDFRAFLRWLLRTALFSLLLFAFLNPTLRFDASEAAPARLAVLLDDSLSMGIADGADGTVRSEQMLREFDVDGGTTSNALKQNFEVEHHHFSSNSQRMQPQQELSFAGASSNITGALNSVASKGITAVVLVSDGGNSNNQMEQTLNALIAADIKVFTVGVGQEQFATELDVAALDMPQSVLTDDTIFADIHLRHHGVSETALNIIVEQDGVILKEHPVSLDPSQTSTRAAIPLTFDNAGPRQLSFRLATVEGELIADNNVIERSIDVTDDRFRVLHFEGEPRFEVKFLRRALTDDANIQLTSLIRTADNKFFRIGLEHRDELARGFPVERSEFYRFDAIVLGSVERSLITDQQLELLRDFVAVRGGGLVALGGAGAYASGGYADSVLEDLLPVELNTNQRETLTRVSVSPTAMGSHSLLLSGVLSNPFDDADTSVANDWQRLPQLTMVNPIQEAKTGATVLLEGIDQSLDRYIVMAQHRYGHGTVIALPVRDSWRWQFHSSIEPEDTTHEAFWRRMLRSLVTAARTPVAITPTQGTAVAGETLELFVDTRDPRFEAKTDAANIELSVTSPSGIVERISATAVAGESGRYRASVVAMETGRYDFRVLSPPAANPDDDETTTDTDAPVSSRTARTHIDVSRDGDEFRSAERNEALLRHIATRTGGSYFDIDNLSALVDGIDASAQQRLVTRKLALADAPFLLALLVLFFVAELMLRRRRQLA